MDGTVGGSGYYEVAYAYAKATTGRNTIRRTSETLGGKTFTLNYTSSGSPDVSDAASRVYSIKDGATPLVQYEYLGAGQVVGTMYDEPDVFSRQYSSTAGVYPDLDTLNRVVGSKWTKDLSTDVDFYRYTLTYDRNSNITKADQVDDSNGDLTIDGHVGFDIAYTMDGLNRLTVADEGTFSGGSITSRTRKQEWTLTQTGNWALDKLDLNGDADWSDTDEWQDGKTFNKVNEIGTRDLDNTPGTTGNNYTLAYDPAGNMTDDGTDYDYEWDAFYRLRKVKTQGGALVAEYRYNGLGYRTGVLEDTNASGTTLTDGSDLWYYSAYDDRWRMVATYRSSDTDPKERFVHQQAGDGGFGGSSYIDLVAFREKDANTAWTSASDGTLEERLYYCQNQHADVVALITAAGGQREMDRYSAYGVPFGLPTGDCDSDGDCDTTDRNQVQTWINAPNQYDVRGDLDLDGDSDATDKTNIRNNFEGVTLGFSGLSSNTIRNARGLSGYEVLSASAPGHYYIRNRILVCALGSWLRRDPVGYVDGANLYLLLVLNPERVTDPLGTEATCGMPDSSGGDGAAELGGEGPGFELPGAPGFAAAGPWEEWLALHNKCCKDAIAQAAQLGKPKIWGIATCCGNTMITCTQDLRAGDPDEGKREAGKMMRECAAEHEREHIPYWRCSTSQANTPYGVQSTPVRRNNTPVTRKEEDNAADKADFNCLSSKRGNCQQLQTQSSRDSCHKEMSNQMFNAAGGTHESQNME